MLSLRIGSPTRHRECQIISQHLEGIEAAPGYYLTKHYIRTRTALWLTTQELLNQLKQPRNWMLTYDQ